MTTENKPADYTTKFKTLPEHIEKIPSKRHVTYNDTDFVVRKNNRASLYGFIKYEKVRKQMLEDSHAESLKGNGVESQFGIIPRYDRYNYYVDLMKFILIGDLSIIDVETLDMNEAEEIILAFLPESMRLSATLIGF